MQSEFLFSSGYINKPEFQLHLNNVIGDGVEGKASGQNNPEYKKIEQIINI